MIEHAAGVLVVATVCVVFLFCQIASQWHERKMAKIERKTRLDERIHEQELDEDDE